MGQLPLVWGAGQGTSATHGFVRRERSRGQP
jgi:hypothetical protein